jgi:two-component system, NtrC family, response regulator HydG
VVGERELQDVATEAVLRVAAGGVLRAFCLRVVEGPDLDKRFEFDGSHPLPVLVGQGPACDARIDDPTVSRRHAALNDVGGRLMLRDLGSTNGTLVNGLRIVEVELRGGETLRMGATVLVLEPATSAGSSRISQRTSFGHVLGASSAMRRLYALCERLALSEVPVLVEGETGTGKEQLAEALHSEGPRKSAPFVVFDCTAVAPSLIESELFGHEKGSFTGAVATHPGVFERAHAGTLLIDEIGDLPLELQPKLLRVLERNEVTRVGGRRPIDIDVRVIAATRRDLDREVQFGRFRDDLFHRLVVTRIELPPLRERSGDVSLLARHFCKQLAADELPHGLLSQWEDYSWPGNVRELRNAVARRIALGDLADDTPGDTSNPAPSGLLAVARRDDPFAKILALDLPLAEARERIVDLFETRYLRHVLEAHSGNVTRAAAAAGVGRRHLQRIKARNEPK